MFSRDELAAITDSRPEPLYHQLLMLLKSKIERGDWRSGALLPSEGELSRAFGLGRVTARRALDELRQAGLVTRRRGVGTVLLARDAPSRATRSTIASLVDSLGWTENSRLRLLECTRMEAPPSIVAALRLSPPAAVDRVERVRLLDDLPVAYYLSHTIPLGGGFNARLLSQGSRIEQLRSLGVELESVDQVLSAAPADAVVARHLGVEPGTALLRIVRIATDVLGRRVDHLLGLYRPDRFQYSLRINLKPPRPR